VIVKKRWVDLFGDEIKGIRPENLACDDWWVI